MQRWASHLSKNAADWLIIISDHAHSFSALAPTCPQKKEGENDAVREKANVSLIYITRLIQSNMAIHQWGSQWQAITVLPGTSAPCLCCWCCSSMGPQLPNSSWKQYLYIYHIFTQYLPFRKTMSYLTISLPVPPLPPCSLVLFMLPPPSIRIFLLSPLAFQLFVLSFFSSISRFRFSIEFFFLPPHLSIRRVYRWNWIFLLFHGGQLLLQLPSQSKDPHHCERKKYKRQGIKKNSNSLYLCISAADLLSLSSTQPVILLFLALFWPLFWGKKQIFWILFAGAVWTFKIKCRNKIFFSVFSVIKIEIHIKWLTYPLISNPGMSFCSCGKC